MLILDSATLRVASSPYEAVLHQLSGRIPEQLTALQKMHSPITLGVFQDYFILSEPSLLSLYIRLYF